MRHYLIANVTQIEGQRLQKCNLSFFSIRNLLEQIYTGKIHLLLQDAFVSTGRLFSRDHSKNIERHCAATELYRKY